MPKKKRSQEEIEAVKDDILVHATDLICDLGYRGFSMRKLASRLGIAAKTIYNYYHSKDELYLAILTEGFEQLFDACLEARNAHQEPLDQLRAMACTYLDFGIENPNLYNLMFTWVVPKYNDYVGTEMESVAQIELETALKPPRLFAESILAYAQNQLGKNIPEEEAQVITILFWTQAHGYVAGINNTLLNYMHQGPLTLQDRVVEAILSNLDRIPIK